MTAPAAGRCEATPRAACRAFMDPARIERWTPLDPYSGEADIDPDLCESAVYVRLPLADGGDLVVSPLPDGGGCFVPRAGTPCVWWQWAPEVHPMRRLASEAHTYGVALG